VARLEAVFDLIGRMIVPELEGQPSRDFRHWVLVQDAKGIEFSLIADDALPVHEILDSLLRDGADAAAYVTHRRPDPERVVAQVLVAKPLNSDTRRADVVRTGNSISLSRWQGPIS
jgi:hypothetical protein